MKTQFDNAQCQVYGNSYFPGFDGEFMWEGGEGELYLGCTNPFRQFSPSCGPEEGLICSVVRYRPDTSALPDVVCSSADSFAKKRVENSSKCAKERPLASY